jgi:hypothetical protein
MGVCALSAVKATNLALQSRHKKGQFYVSVTVRRNKFLYNKTNQMYQFPTFTPT